MLAQHDGQKPPERVGLNNGQWMVTAVHVQLAEGVVTGYAISDTRTRLGFGPDDYFKFQLLKNFGPQAALTYQLSLTQHAA